MAVLMTMSTTLEVEENEIFIAEIKKGVDSGYIEKKN